MKDKPDKTKEELLSELESLRQKLAESQIVARQRNWAEQRLKESQEHFKRLSELTNEGVVIHDKGTILDANQTFADMFGYPISEYFGMDLFKLVSPESQDLVHNNIAANYEGKYEVIAIRKDGFTFPIEVYIKITHHENRKVRVAIIRDITDTKRREERLRAINKCFLEFGSDLKENINRIVALCGKSLGADCALYSYLEEDILYSVGQWNAPPDFKSSDNCDGHICYDVIKKASDKIVFIPDLLKSPYAKTDSNVTKYGLQTYVGIVVKSRGQAIGALCVLYKREFTPSEEDGNLMQILASAIGIEEERKRAYEARRQNIELYRSLVRTSPEGIFSYDVDGKIIMVNQRAAAIFKLENKEEAIGRNIFDFVAPQDKQRSKENLLKVMETGSLLNKEYNLLRIDGSVFIGEISSSVIKNNKGNITALIGTVRDITQRKTSEETIKKSEGLLSQAQRLAHIGNFEYTLPAKNIFWSEELYNIFGYNPKYAPPTLDEFYKRVHPDDRKKHNAAFESAISKGESFGISYRIVMPDSSLRFLNVISEMESDSEGKPLRLVGTIQDVTEQRKTEDKLKMSEETHRMLVDNIPICLAAIDKDAKFTLWNKSFEKMLGYKANEVVGKLTPFDLHESKEGVDKVLKTVVEKGIFDGEIVYIAKNKKKILAHLIVVAKKDSLGNIIGFHSFAEDITVQRTIEKVTMFTKFVFDNMGDAAFWITSDAKIAYVNSAACRLLGYSRRELLKKTVHDIDPNLPKKVWKQRWQEAKQKKTAVIETSFRTKEKDVFPVEITGNYMQYNGQEYLCALARDITERGRIEQVLRTAEEERTMILDSLSEIVVYHDTGMNIVWANKKARELIGSVSKKLIGYHCYKVWYKRKSSCRDCSVKRALRTGNAEQGEILLPDGKYWFIRGYPVKDSKGKVIGVVEVSLDVTEKKNIEKERTKSVEKSRRILEETVVALAATAERRDPYTAGHQRRVAQLACAIAQELKLPEEQSKGLRMAAIIHDVGKVYVPAEILSKPSRLTDLEFSIIKTHPQVGYEILKPVEFPWPVALIVLQHQERNDGSGYPNGIKGEDILLEAKILTVADVVEAMASHRPYRPALGVNSALKEIQNNRGILYDEKIVDTCIKIFRKKKFKFEDSK
ncbi:MAG: PAS domain S-box protein [Omnitrophica bacterium]|nr:PAS domain S-box protein [Candidatus Omnitrophota bacterium]